MSPAKSQRPREERLYKEEGWTKLHFAAYHGHVALTRYLIKFCDADFQAEAPRQGETPLHLAAREGHADVVKSLLRFGANVDALDKQGLTPMQVAERNGHQEALQPLLEDGIYFSEEFKTTATVEKSPSVNNDNEPESKRGSISSMFTSRYQRPSGSPQAEPKRMAPTSPSQKSRHSHEPKRSSVSSMFSPKYQRSSISRDERGRSSITSIFSAQTHRLSLTSFFAA